MANRTTLSHIVNGDVSTRDAKIALRDELAKRVVMASDRDVSPIANLLNKVLDDLEAMPDPNATTKTPEQKEADEVAAARATRAARKASGETVGRKAAK